MTIATMLEEQQRLLNYLPVKFTRYIYNTIEWRNRMICLVGPRGVGKTTLLLQHIKRQAADRKCLYYSIDDILLQRATLVQLADEWVKAGGDLLVIDEIHKYPRWSQELKRIYDSQPSLQVVFTGSSILDIYSGMADLSRRAALYEMQGLSFREYLALFHEVDTQPLRLPDILAHRYQLPVEHPLPLFADYLQQGYYPFSQDFDFTRKLNQVVLQTMETDIPIYANLNASTGMKLRNLLAIIADSVPFKPNMTKLSEVVGVSRNQMGDYLLYMERAGIIAQLRNATGGIRGLGKVNKVYLDNPNLCHALAGGNPNKGNIRETFFFNQMRVGYDVISSNVSDFMIDGYTFKVGGKNKGQRQVSSVENGFVVKDDIEFGALNNIPLWAFGMTY